MNAQEIAEIVKSSAKVMPIGGRSKPAVSGDIPDGALSIDMTQLAGIVEYEPDEYTITAKAGTTLKTLIEAVNANGQYLPFDPLLVEAGATIGGTVAANTSGSGRFRYGGVRDFILGIYFVDGQGNIVRGGGKVVKNASGFDLPKFMVGSLGRYGILTEVTLKVFPKPAEYRTLKLAFNSLQDALDATFALANQPFEMDALDFRRAKRDGPMTKGWIRLGGLPESLPGRIERLSAWLSTNTTAKDIEEKKGEAEHWAAINGIDWAASGANLVKVPVAPKKLRGLDQVDVITAAHYFAAGNVALVTADDLAGLDSALTELGLNGQLLRGSADSPFLGNRSWLALAQRVKNALDPQNKFLDV
ncbi:MAG: glycolate oxidase FAD binding subunit [Cellvibrionaceae bacterium]|jgi:glycolate oxidase FAD binding subunit